MRYVFIFRLSAALTFAASISSTLVLAYPATATGHAVIAVTVVLAYACATADSAAIQPHIVSAQHVAVGVFKDIPCITCCNEIFLLFVFVFVSRAWGPNLRRAGGGNRGLDEGFRGRIR